MYEVFVRLSPQLARISHQDHGMQLWVLVKLRKDTKCKGCSRELQKRTQAFCPLTNALNRAHRLCTDCVGT